MPRIAFVVVAALLCGCTNYVHVGDEVGTYKVSALGDGRFGGWASQTDGEILFGSHYDMPAFERSTERLSRGVMAQHCQPLSYEVESLKVEGSAATFTFRCSSVKP